MGRKPFTSEYQPKKRRGKNKPKPLAARLAEIFGEVSEKNLRELVDLALTHAKGDTIITESQDGEKLTAKCVSDPRLFGIISKTVTDHEEKHRAAIPAMPILDGLRKELENIGEPDDDSAA